MTSLLKIDSSELPEMLASAASSVIKNQKKINLINVFPVPDADTGSNLAKTLKTLSKITNSKFDIDEILSELLESSQGNSGIMMTAYLSGFLNTIKTKKIIDFENLTKGFRNGAKQAREAVEQPKIGTMLDVMDEFIKEFSKKGSIKDSLNAARNTLVATEKKMKVLSDNKVVDAGALGFTIFIYAFFSQEFDFEGLDLKQIEKSKEDFGKYPYEIIFIASECAFKIDDLRTMFSPLGDSLDIVEIDKKVKLHIHTNEPELVRDTAKLVGEIESVESVDMRESNTHL